MRANYKQPQVAEMAPREESSQVQRKIFGFIYIYAILVITLYVTYAAYYFYQHHHQQQQQQSRSSSSSDASNSFDMTTSSLPAAGKLASGQQELLSLAQSEANLELWKQEFEGKFKFFEKYVEMLSIELQETQRKLNEREKCDCSLSCTFNGTKFADRSSWQNQCDICTCQSGKISCQPQKCPQISCDDPVQLPGQCCPICMKRCKYNSTVIRHGQKFSPPETNKECKCQDGRIKCEQTQQNNTKKLSTKVVAARAPTAAALLTSRIPQTTTTTLSNTTTNNRSDQPQQMSQPKSKLQSVEPTLKPTTKLESSKVISTSSKDNNNNSINKASQMSAGS